MKSYMTHLSKNVAVAAAAALLMLATSPTARAGGSVLPPNSHGYGKTYSQWSVAWWQWALALPVDGHPFIDSPSFDVTEGQSGHVWFLASPNGTVVREATIPAGTALFCGLLNSEWSSLEGFLTEADQRAFAELFTAHIVGLFVTIDGVPVKNLASFRVESPQFTFTAPTPWIFGDTGGTGTTVADGYYLLLAPLSVGSHTLHWGGSFHFSVAEGDDFDLDSPLDITYHLTVTPAQE